MARSAVFRARPRRASGRPRRTAGRGGRPGRRQGARVGGGAGAGLPPNAQGGARGHRDADPCEHPFHCHHEKLVIVDGTVAFVGGIDMTDFAGDRFDTSDHPARRRLGWHDVGTRLRGPALADVEDHLALRWRELTGEQLDRPAAPPPAGGHTVQVVRTIANGMYDAIPSGEYRILESYVRALSGARDFVYLENQFLWSPEIVRLLADK